MNAFGHRQLKALACADEPKSAPAVITKTMIGDPDHGSVYDRLWELLFDRFSYIFPILIIEEPERVTIVDYRPTLTMLLTAAGIVIFALSFVFLFFGMDIAIVSGLWVIAVPFAVCAIFLFKGTVREVYCFDRSCDKFTLARRFIHRAEVIEGPLSQFTSAYVKTESSDSRETYFVVLKQEGMFLSGVDDQTLREDVPIFNWFEKEARVANAINAYISNTNRRSVS